MMFDGPRTNGCHSIYPSGLHGSKDMAVTSKSGDCGGSASIFNGQAFMRLASSSLQADAAGCYPVPQRGITKQREYLTSLAQG